MTAHPVGDENGPQRIERRATRGVRTHAFVVTTSREERGVFEKYFERDLHVRAAFAATRGEEQVAARCEQERNVETLLRGKRRWRNKSDT